MASTISKENKNTKDKYHDIVGLVPAAGLASRLAPLPCSKELYPVGFQAAANDSFARPKVVCQYLFEKMRLAGVSKVYIVLRKGKWDIPAYLGDGQMLDLHFAYLMMNVPYGAPFTLDQAYPFVKDSIVAFGFPDIIFAPNDAFVRITKKLQSAHCDAVLGLFPTDMCHENDMVDLDEKENVRQILTKPTQTEFRYTWCIAVWTPAFTRFMHEHLVAILNARQNEHSKQNHPETRELIMGDVIHAAIRSGLQIKGEILSNGTFIDIGTPGNLAKAVINNLNL